MLLGGQGAGSCRARPLDWYPLLIARLWVMVWCESGRVDLDILCQNTARPRSTVCVYDGCVWQSHLKQKKALSSNCNLTRLVILYWASTSSRHSSSTFTSNALSLSSIEP